MAGNTLKGNMETKIGIGEWKMRNGEKAIIAVHRPGTVMPWVGWMDGETVCSSTWKDDGSFDYGKSPEDIISPWTSPIAPGHNPDKLTVEQVGNGWWLPEWEVLEKVTKPIKLEHIHGWFGKQWCPTHVANDGLMDHGTTYRTRLTSDELLALIAPKKRLIRVEELPAVCWVGCDQYSWMVNQRCLQSQKIWSGQGSAWDIPGIHAIGRKWSSDLLTWNSFEVEDK